MAIFRNLPARDCVLLCMKPLSRCVSLFALFLTIGVLPSAARPRHDDIAGHIHQLLDLYARKDVTGLMNLISKDGVLVMGSDLSEVCTTPEQVRELLRNDFLQWQSASFGNPRHIFTQRSGNLVTAFFDVPFTIQRGEERQSFVIRFSTVWRKESGGLKLIQSATTVPTKG